MSDYQIFPGWKTPRERRTFTSADIPLQTHGLQRDDLMVHDDGHVVVYNGEGWEPLLG